jgi:hypothetical protein
MAKQGVGSSINVLTPQLLSIMRSTLGILVAMPVALFLPHVGHALTHLTTASFCWV